MALKGLQSGIIMEGLWLGIWSGIIIEGEGDAGGVCTLTCVGCQEKAVKG